MVFTEAMGILMNGILTGDKAIREQTGKGRKR
jgi:hypothetical protein